MIYIEIVFLSLVPYVLTDVLQVGIRAEGPVAMTSDGSFQVFQVADVGAAVAGIEESLYLVVGFSSRFRLDRVPSIGRLPAGVSGQRVPGR